MDWDIRLDGRTIWQKSRVRDISNNTKEMKEKSENRSYELKNIVIQ